MTIEIGLHRRVSLVVSLLLILFVAVMFRIHIGFDHERLEEIASLAVVCLSAAIFMVLASVETAVALEFKKNHRRELWIYLFLAFTSLGSGVFLAVYGQATIQTVALVAAPHAFLFGLALLRTVHHLSRHSAYQRAFLVGGIAEIGLGAMLLYASSVTRHDAAVCLAFVAMLTTLQILPLVFYSRQKQPSA